MPSPETAEKKKLPPSCYEEIIKERTQLVLPKGQSYIKPKDAVKPPWVPKERTDEHSWSPRTIEKSTVDNQVIQRTKHDLEFVNMIIKKKQDEDKEAERKKLYALADPETESTPDPAANFQAIKKPKIFADEQFKQNIAQMMQQAKDIQGQIEKERLKKQELEDYIKKELGRKIESEFSVASKKVASRRSTQKLESLEGEGQGPGNEALEIDDESQPAPEARSSA